MAALRCEGMIAAEPLASSSISDAVIKCVSNKQLREGRVYLAYSPGYSPLQWGSHSGCFSKPFTLYPQSRAERNMNACRLAGWLAYLLLSSALDFPTSVDSPNNPPPKTLIMPRGFLNCDREILVVSSWQ